MKYIAILIVFLCIGLDAQVTVNVNPVNESGTNAYLKDVGTGLDKSGSTVSFDPTEIDYYQLNSFPLIDVKQYGASGNGVDDDYLDVQTSIDTANGKTVIFPSGTYIVNTRIDDTATNDIVLIGQGDVLLDGSGNTGESSYGTLNLINPAYSLTITEPIIAGDSVLYCSSTTGLAITDIVQISSSVIYASGQYKGEFYRINRIINDTSFSIESPSYATYDTSEITSYYFHERKLIIDNIDFKGDFDASVHNYAIYAERFTNVIIKDCEIKEYTHSGIFLNYCLSVKIIQNDIQNIYEDGFGYGTMIASCQDVYGSGNTYRNCRHSWAVGGDYVNRNISFIGNMVYGKKDHAYGIECHPGAEFINYSNNILYDAGIVVRGNNAVISNNTVVTTNSNRGIAVENYSKSKYYDLSGNRILRNDTSSATNYGIYIQLKKNNDTIVNLVVRDNIIENVSFPVYLGSDSTTGTYVEKYIIDNNVISGITNETAIIYTTNKLNFREIRINNNDLRIDAYGISMNAKDSCNLLHIAGNTIHCTSDNNILTTTNKFKDINFSNNHIVSSGGDCISFTCTRNVYFINNVLEGLQNGGVKINSPVVNYYNNANIFINCTGDVTNNASNTYTISYTQ